MALEIEDAYKISKIREVWKTMDDIAHESVSIPTAYMNKYHKNIDCVNEIKANKAHMLQLAEKMIQQINEIPENY